MKYVVLLLLVAVLGNCTTIPKSRLAPIEKNKYSARL